MKRIFYIAFCMLVASCTSPADIAYCERLGVNPEHPEYTNCLNYYEAQHGAYSGDYAECSIEADKTYPKTLYDRGHTVYTGGFGFGGYGRYNVGGTGWIPPDAGHNAHVDALRNRIIEPCMREKGWRDPQNWEAGRGKPAAKKQPSTTPLPWAK